MIEIPDDALANRARIERGTDAADTNGFIDPWLSPTVVASGVACSIQARRERDSIYSSGRVVNGRTVAYFRFATDIRRGDRVVNEDNDAVYDVLSVQDEAGRGVLWKVALEPFQPQRDDS